MTDLFTAPTNADTNTEVGNPLETLVGEGKKFKTTEDLAKAKMESDRFIQQLQGELSGLRTELSTRQTLEQLMDKFGAQRVPETTTQSHNQNSQDGDGQNAVKTFSEDDITRLVEDRLSKVEQARIHQANLASVQKALVESIGPDYVTHLKAKATELGVTEEYLNTMAKETPKAFLKLIDADSSQRATTPGLFTPPASHGAPSPNKQHFTPTGQRKQSWYNDLKSKDASKYWSPEVQNQMHRDAINLGESFFDS